MRADEYPKPHQVKIVGKRLRDSDGRISDGSIGMAETVVIDGRPTCLPMGAEVKVEAETGGAGYQVTFTILAATVRTEGYEYVPKHLAPADDRS